jgi:hypothetical protein
MQDDDNIQLQSYQDDLNTDDNAVDPLMAEETDDPTEALGIPPLEFKEELDKLEVDTVSEDELDLVDADLRDDQEAFIEDEDEDPDEYPGSP